jgi:hypothetical protein
MGLTAERAAQSSLPANPDLARSAGVGAQVGSEAYVEALVRVVFYWAYPGVDTFGRTNMWQIMAGRRGSMLGIMPAGPKIHPQHRHHYGAGLRTSPRSRWWSRL